MRLGKASSSPSRNSVGLLSQVRLPATGYPRRPAGPRTSTYARTDQLYGTIPAVPSIYDACQPDRRVNNDRAAPPPLSSVDRTDNSPTIKLLSRQVASPYDANQQSHGRRVRTSKRIGKSTPTRVKPRRIRIPPPEKGKEQLGETGYGQIISLRRANTRLKCLPASSARPRAASTPIRDETLRIDPILIAFLRII
jgi:hypothetical protein